MYTQFRGGVGQLQWLQFQRDPLLSFATGILQRKFATPNGHDLLSFNKLMREAKIDAGSVLVDCFSAVIICLAHGRRCSLSKSSRWIIHEWLRDHVGTTEHSAR